MNAFIQQLRDSTQLMVFTVCIGAGIAYLVVSWLLGQFGADHADGDGHVDIDHADAGHGTVSIFSPKIIALFCVGLGAGGALATVYGFGMTTSSLIGVASGGSLGGLMLAMLRALHGQQSTSSLELGSAIGRVGNVTVEVPPGGTGEIGLSVSGQYTTFFARANASDLSIPRGRTVKVVSVSGSTLIIELA